MNLKFIFFLSTLALLFVSAAKSQSCQFTNSIDLSFYSSRKLNCSNKICTLQNTETILLACCSPVSLTTASSLRGATLSADLSSPNGCQIALTCRNGKLTATDFQKPWSTIKNVKSVKQTRACCKMSDMIDYNSQCSKVKVAYSPRSPTNGWVSAATISNCYRIDPMSNRSSILRTCFAKLPEVFKEVRNKFLVKCVGQPGEVGKWDRFPACMPFSLLQQKNYNKHCLITKGDRGGSGIMSINPVRGLSSAKNCCDACWNHTSCVGFAYFARNNDTRDNAYKHSDECFLKLDVPPLSAPLFKGWAPYVYTFLERNITCCTDGSSRECSKWCDGVKDCPGGEDEMGCPSPNVNTVAGNAGSI